MKCRQLPAHIFAMMDSVSSKLWIVFFAVLAGLVAIRIQYIHMGWINPDSVLYLEAAKYIATGDWHKAMTIYNWPFYSICIAAIAKLFHITFFLSAQILSCIFFIVTTLAFLNVLVQLGAQRLGIFIGALTLFGSIYIVGDVLPMLMRDQGFWAFFLLSIWAFLKFVRTPNWYYGTLWQITLLLAFLFRIEALFYFALPLFWLINKPSSWANKFFEWLKLNYLTLIFSVVLLTSIAIHGLSDVGRLTELTPSNVWQSYSSLLLGKSAVFAHDVLGHYLEEYALLILSFGLVIVTVIKVALCAGPINLAWAAYHYRLNKNTNQAMYVLYLLMAISFASMLLIITKVFVLSGRYTIALSFMMMMISTLGIELCIMNSSSRRIKWLAYLSIIVLALSLMKNLMPKPEGFNFRQMAIHWLKENNLHQEKVFFNEIRLAYYYQDENLFDTITRRDEIPEASKHCDLKTLSDYKYLVIYVTKESQMQYQCITQSLSFKEVGKFYNQDKKKNITIYKRNTSS